MRCAWRQERSISTTSSSRAAGRAGGAPQRARRRAADFDAALPTGAGSRSAPSAATTHSRRSSSASTRSTPTVVEDRFEVLLRLGDRRRRQRSAGGRRRAATARAPLGSAGPGAVSITSSGRRPAGDRPSAHHARRRARAGARPRAAGPRDPRSWRTPRSSARSVQRRSARRARSREQGPAMAQPAVPCGPPPVRSSAASTSGDGGNRAHAGAASSRWRARPASARRRCWRPWPTRRAPRLERAVGAVRGARPGAAVVAVDRGAPRVGLGGFSRSVRHRFVARRAGDAVGERATPANLVEVADELATELTSGTRPRLIVLYDLHWADPPTLDLLALLIQRIGVAPVVIAIGHRPADLTATPALARRCPRWPVRPTTTRITLDGLDVHAVADLLGDVGGRVPATRLPPRCTERSGGNPLFVIELAPDSTRCASLRTNEIDGDPRHRPRSAGTVAGTTVEMLTLAATLGSAIDLRVLMSMADSPMDACLDAIEPAVAALLLGSARTEGSASVTTSCATCCSPTCRPCRRPGCTSARRRPPTRCSAPIATTRSRSLRTAGRHERSTTRSASPTRCCAPPRAPACTPPTPAPTN